MKVTVAICTWNRAKLLDQTLTAMHNLHIPHGIEWDLLIVNNNCTDETDNVIRKHAHVLPITRLFEPKSGQSNARNCAIAHAQCDWIVWTDDDVLVDPDWLFAFSETATRYPDAVAIGGRIMPWFPCEPDPDLMVGFPALRNGYCGLDLGPDECPLTVNQTFYGANMAFNSAKVKGLRFDPRLGHNDQFQGGGDDLAFYKSALTRGALALWSPRMVVRHYVGPERMTLAYLRNLLTDGAERVIRMEGIPAGPRLFGVPRWLLRRYLENYCFSMYCALKRDRPAYYRSLTAFWTVRGTIRGCMKAYRQGDNANGCE
jgi:glucosyl-dolichyl phosphate glucuronosyltransferase